MNLDASVLRALKRLAAEQGKSLGDVISEVVAPALASNARATRAPRFRWRSSRMGPARVDLEDKEAVRLAIENG